MYSVTLLCIGCAVLMAKPSLGAVFQGIIEEKSGFSNQCYYQHDADKVTFFPEGTESYDLDQCIRYSCKRQDDGKLIISGAGCGAMKVQPPCTISKRSRGRYPDCCPKPSCPDK